jgi:hypothetical protein
MTLRQQYSLINSEFNAFLFAPVGETANGAELTVLSALTRLDLDPWAEAARLASLSRETATRTLAAVIASLPDGEWRNSDAGTIATRLVTLLPRPAAPMVKIAPAAKAWKNRGALTPAVWIACILIVTLLVAMSSLRADHGLQTPAETSTITQH